MADASPGQVVGLLDGRQGIVRFVGQTHFATGDWIGIELDEPTGKNDGSVQGERYFNCEHGFGMFIRLSAIKTLKDPPPKRESKPAARAASGAVHTARPLNGTTSGGLGMKRTSLVGVGTGKRTGAIATSTSPTPQGTTISRSLRSPTKSPTKGLTAPSRPSSIGAKPSAAAKPRPSAVSTKASMAPQPQGAAASRASRLSMTGSQMRMSKPSGLDKASTANTTKRLPPRLTVTGKLSEDTMSRASPAASDGSPQAATPQEEEERQAAEKQPEDAITRTSETMRASTTRSLLSASVPQRNSQQNASLARELDDLKTKLKVIEKKRAEDREKLKVLETLQAERDKFEGIIQKLQMKYQPQQAELTGVRKKLREVESQLDEAEKKQAEHESILEMAALDREMAEETAEAFKVECQTLKLRLEELELEVEVLREENQELTSEISPEERSSQGWLQMEKTNERLREALIRLRDMTQQTEQELRDQVKELQDDIEEYAAVKAQYEATKEKLLASESNVDDLKAQLETALGAEEMIEELADKNLRYQEEINELKVAIEDLESLKEISDELELHHVETEKQLQEEIDYREIISNEQYRKAAQQDELIEDLEYTLTRFRELVSNLQSDLEDMRASQQITETEANELTTRSRAMMDLNMKLQASVAKAQSKTIDTELNRLEAQESAQHLSILQMYLPEYFDSEKNSILAYLRVKRVGTKASIMNQLIRERISDHGDASIVHENTFAAYDVLEKLLWISCVCERFSNFVDSCSPDQFANFAHALYELEPVERTLNAWVEGLKKSEFNEKKCADELQRSIALLSHLAETIIPVELAAYADEITFRAVMIQTYIDHTASAMARMKTFVQAKVSPPTDDDEEGLFLFTKLDVLINQSRSLKVMITKVVRILEDLKSRSLALSDEAAEPVERAEASAKALADYSRQLGHNIVLLLSDEGRVEPFSYSEIMLNMSQTTTLFGQEATSDDGTKDAISLIAARLKILTTQLEDLSVHASDLSRTSEFERAKNPWIFRSQELKSKQTTSPDIDEEIRRLRNELGDASTVIGVKDKILEEQSMKVELLESRMRDATKKASTARDFEAKFEDIRVRQSGLINSMEKVTSELRATEAERDDYKARLEHVKRASGTASGSVGGAVVDSEASLAAIRENNILRAEVESLQAAVRYLREEYRRSNLLETYSVQRSAQLHAWLDTPLRPTRSAEQDARHQRALESKDVFAHLIKLTKHTSVTDLSATVPQDGTQRLAWRPSKLSYRFQVLQQREKFTHWRDWKDDVSHREREEERITAAKRQRVLFHNGERKRAISSHTPTASLGYGIMGRAWSILGMQDGLESKGSVPTSGEANTPINKLDIVSSP